MIGRRLACRSRGRHDQVQANATNAREVHLDMERVSASRAVHNERPSAWSGEFVGHAQSTKLDSFRYHGTRKPSRFRYSRGYHRMDRNCAFDVHGRQVTHTRVGVFENAPNLVRGAQSKGYICVYPEYAQDVTCVDETHWVAKGWDIAGGFAQEQRVGGFGNS